MKNTLLLLGGLLAGACCLFACGNKGEVSSSEKGRSGAKEDADGSGQAVTARAPEKTKADPRRGAGEKALKPVAAEKKTAAATAPAGKGTLAYYYMPG